MFKFQPKIENTKETRLHKIIIFVSLIEREILLVSLIKRDIKLTGSVAKKYEEC
jgi:hypothetical protein